MKTLTLAGILLATLSVTASAQRMGHSNTHAPLITQNLKMGDRAQIKVEYTAITFSGGEWATALANENTRDGVRDQINAAASKDPLGSLETDKDLTVAGKKVPAGNYKLAFMLNKRYRWQMVLTGETTVEFNVKFNKASIFRHRLTLNLDAGEANFTAVLHISFGNETGRLTVTPGLPALEIIAGFANAMCPLMDEEVDPEFFVMFKKHKIGMCCEDCVDDWAELSEKEKSQTLAEILQK